MDDWQEGLQQSMAKGDWPAAARILDDRLKSEPSDRAVLLTAAQVAAMLGDYQNSHEHFDAYQSAGGTIDE
ncbi:MAG: hypothetical protein AAFP69_09690, partial [Planctomycetota bacterium]